MKKNSVYIVEFRARGINNMVALFTRMPYEHTGMIIENTFCELQYRPGQASYTMRNYDSMSEFTKDMEKKGFKIEIYKVPKFFKNEEIKDMLQYWKDHLDKKYGFYKLLSMAITPFLMPLYLWYYRLFHKPYKPKWDLPKEQVCSTFVDTCLRVKGKHDIFPEFSERCTFPGLFAYKLKKYQIYP